MTAVANYITPLLPDSGFGVQGAFAPMNASPKVSRKLKFFSTFVMEQLPASSEDLAPDATQILEKKKASSQVLLNTLLQAKLFSP